LIRNGRISLCGPQTTRVAKPQASQQERDNKRDSRDAKEEEYNPKRRCGDAADRLIYKVLDRYDLSITKQEDARLKPYHRAIRIAFKTHEKKDSGWEMKASKALKNKTNAILYIEAGETDRDEILEAFMAEIIACRRLKSSLESSGL